MRTCFLFPGQGAQYPGMGRDLWESCEAAQELFEIGSEVTGIDLKRLLFEGSEEELQATDNTQVAVTVVNLSAAAALREIGIEADGCAGFSLGEYSALCLAGVLSVRELFAIVAARGRLMEEASRALDGPDGQAGMAAVLGLSLEEAAPVLDRLREEGVYLANHSSPIQIVLSGTASGLARAQSLFEEAGAMRFVRLRVSGPFHSPLLEQARRGLEEVLEGYPFADPVRRVYANVTGGPVASGEEARRLCVQQVVSPVCWVEEEASILADGYQRFLEVGPGSVLSGLWKSFHKKQKCLPVGRLEDIERLGTGQ